MRQKTSLPNRGESVVVSYVLVLGIMTVLSALLISAAGGYLDTKNEEVTKTQAEITTEAIAAELEEVDKNARRIDANSSSNGFYKYNSEADELIGQYPYKVSIESHPNPDTYTIRIDIQSVGITEKTNVTFSTIENVSTNTVSSGSSLTYVYQTGGNLSLGDESLNVSEFAINVSGDYSIPSDTEFDAGIKTRNSGDILHGENSIVYGPLISDNRINTEDNILIFGNVTSTSWINFNSNSTITRSVKSGGTVETGNNTTIGGVIDAPGTVISNENTTIQGNINSDDNVGLESYSVISGSITAQNDVITQDNVTIRSKIDSGGNIILNANATVEENIIGDEDVGVGDDSVINGSISANDDVELNEQSTINGDIDADSVVLYDNVEVTGEVNVPSGSNLVCSGSGITINGQSCSDYKSSNY